MEYSQHSLNIKKIAKMFQEDITIAILLRSTADLRGQSSPTTLRASDRNGTKP